MRTNITATGDYVVSISCETKKNEEVESLPSEKQINSILTARKRFHFIVKFKMFRSQCAFFVGTCGRSSRWFYREHTASVENSFLVYAAQDVEDATELSA